MSSLCEREWHHDDQGPSTLAPLCHPELAPLWLVNLLKERRMLMVAKSTETKSTRTSRDVGRICHMITVVFVCLFVVCILCAFCELP